MGGHLHCMIALLLALGTLPRVNAGSWSAGSAPAQCNETALLGCTQTWNEYGAGQGQTVGCQAFANYQMCWNNNAPACKGIADYPSLLTQHNEIIKQVTTDTDLLCPLLKKPGSSSGDSSSFGGSVSLDSTSGVIDQNMMTSSGIKALWWQWTIFFCLICCCFASCGGMAAFISNRREKRGFDPYDDYDHEGGWGGYPDAYAEPFPMPPSHYHDPMAGHSLMGWGAPHGHPGTMGYGGYPQTAQMPTMHAMY